MNKAFVFLWMIFFHIVSDYNLQGWLASAKQKSFWEENAPEKKYKYDYLCALIMHSISWTFMIMLPIAFNNGFNIDFLYLLLFVCNTILHAYIDHEKANKKSINLWVDQLFHMAQIAGTAMILL